MYYAMKYSSPIGWLTLASDGERLVGLWMDGQEHFGCSIQDAMEDKADLPVFGDAKKWLDSYFAGERPAIDSLPLAPIGSAFRQAVWRRLCAIPYGETATYGHIARELSESMKKKTAARAVGGAVGYNPISIIIPCHRVIGSNGKLTGYSGGLGKKAWLLAHEGVHVPS